MKLGPLVESVGFPARDYHRNMTIESCTAKLIQLERANLILRHQGGQGKSVIGYRMQHDRWGMSLCVDFLTQFNRGTHYAASGEWLLHTSRVYGLADCLCRDGRDWEIQSIGGVSGFEGDMEWDSCYMRITEEDCPPVGHHCTTWDNAANIMSMKYNASGLTFGGGSEDRNHIMMSTEPRTFDFYRGRCRTTGAEVVVMVNLIRWIQMRPAMRKMTNGITLIDVWMPILSFIRLVTASSPKITIWTRPP